MASVSISVLDILGPTTTGAGGMTERIGGGLVVTGTGTKYTLKHIMKRIKKSSNMANVHTITNQSAKYDKASSIKRFILNSKAL